MAETVPPSNDPDSATATGTGGSSSGTTPPPSPPESASTSGLGPQTEQHGGSAPAGGDAPLSLTEDAPGDDQEAQSPSGT